MRSRYRQSDWLKLEFFFFWLNIEHTLQCKDKLKVKMSIKNNHWSLHVTESRAGLCYVDQRGSACSWNMRLGL